MRLAHLLFIVGCMPHGFLAADVFFEVLRSEDALGSEGLGCSSPPYIPPAPTLTLPHSFERSISQANSQRTTEPLPELALSREASREASSAVRLADSAVFKVPARVDKCGECGSALPADIVTVFCKTCGRHRNYGSAEGWG